MTRRKGWTIEKAALRRKKITQAKFQKHREHEAEMAKIAERMDKQREQSVTPSVL